MVVIEGDEVKDEASSTARFCLLLPGNTLYLSHLLALKKFRKRGNKEGALAAFYRLEEEGLGAVVGIANSKASQCVSCTLHILFNYFNSTFYL